MKFGWFETFWALLSILVFLLFAVVAVVWSWQFDRPVVPEKAELSFGAGMHIVMTICIIAGAGEIRLRTESAQA